jgi:pimeloyl-ACP methyl ester carboxylesterase
MPGHGRDKRAIQGLSLADYATVVTRELDAHGEPCVLVAHSRGGVVASVAAEARPEKVAAIVYVAAYLVPPNERVLDWAITDKETLVRANLDVHQDEGWDMLRAEAFREALYHDCSDEDVALCHSLLAPEPLGPTLTPAPISEGRWGKIRRSYIMLTEDRAVGPALQRRMLARTPCARTIEIAASHSAYFSKPDELTDAILRCADQ